MKDYRFLCRVASDLDILESISPLSLISEKKNWMTYEVKSAEEKTLLNLQELSKETLADDAIDSFLHKFSIQSNDNEGNGIKISAIYPKKDHMRRKPANHKMIEVELDDMKNANMRSIKEALNLRLSSIKSLVPLIQDRFSSFTESEVIAATTWVDPKAWEEDHSKNGTTAITKIMNTFTKPLNNAAGFDQSKVFTEWKSLQSTVKSSYSNFTSVTNVWSKLFIYRINELPNILMLAEIVFCISASNSTQEKVFSTLTILLSDCRLTMKHSTMEDCLVVAGNSSVWSEREKDEILDGAVKEYLKKRRVKKFPNTKQPNSYIYVNHQRNPYQ